jgi:hypothetical protein
MDAGKGFLPFGHPAEALFIHSHMVQLQGPT